MRFRTLAPLALLAAALASPGRAQTVDVTFRFLPDLTAPAISPVARAFVPGSFNDWGPNDGNGVIATGAASQATYDPPLNEYRYTRSLAPGAHAYKIHYHPNGAGTNGVWLTDPLGTETTGPNSDSVVRVADPMVFQIAREQDGTSEVQAVSAGVFGTAAVASVTFTVNTTTYTTGIEDTGDGVYRLALPAPVAPGSYVRVEATMVGGATASAEVGTIPPAVTDAPVPDGLADGITYDEADPTRAWLVLRAPGKQYVYALGSFNGWATSGAWLMKRDTTDALGTRWWLELTGLTPGTEVLFQYLVDGQIRVADPYTTKVYYPGEAGYPSGKNHAVGVLTPGAAAFPWTDGAFEAPPLAELVVYELLVRDFLRAHRFTALTDTLDYLDRLGVNAIQLMPVSEYDGDESWGYNPAFHLALDKHYGTPDELKAFVDAAHARGIAVILDVVYNHATGQSPLIRLDNQGDFGAPTPTNPWANVSARHPFNVFNDLNHESPLTQLWLDQANRFWMDEYHVDGYRFDLSKGFTQTCVGGVACTDGNFSTYNPARIAILTRMADALWEAHPDARIILEHFAEAREERELAAHGTDRGLPGMTLWNNQTNAYYESAMGYLGNAANLAGAYPPTNGYPLWGQITYMESHDEQWQLYKTRAFGNRAGDYDTRALATALDRKKLATAFFLTLPGPRMLWQFGEVGFGGGPGECLLPNNECPTGTPGRVSNKPIRWDYWADVAPFANGTGLSLPPAGAEERDRRRKLYGVTSALLELRQSAALFRSAETQVTARLGGGVPDRWIRLALPSAPAGQPTQAVVFGNFGVAPATVSLTFDAATTWYDYFDGTSAGYPAGTHTLSLRPGEFHVWTDVALPTPPGDLGAVADEGGPDAPEGDGLVAVYPNPTAGQATVALDLAEARAVRVELVDALGRRVATLVDGPLPAGRSQIAVETAGLPAGVYVVRSGGRSIPLTVVR